MSSLKEQDAMEPKTKRAKQEENERDRDDNEDRLSDLSDGLLLHIMSFMCCRDAVQTCIFSRRWEHLWKLLPTLKFHSVLYPFKNFSEFIFKILSLRDGSVALHTLDFVSPPIVDSLLFSSVISYALSHNVQRLTICTGVNVDQLPPHIFSSIFSCQTLTFLKLEVYHKSSDAWRLVFPNHLKLPALTSLHLKKIAFTANKSDQAEPFSTLNKLNNLVIDYGFTLVDAQTLCISSTMLSSLTIRCSFATPYKIVLSSPNLRSFAFEGVPCHSLSGSSLSFLEQVYIDADTHNQSSELPLILLNWLKELTKVQSLTVTINTLRVLFFIPDLMKIKLPSLRNLKSLKVKMQRLSCGALRLLGPFNSWNVKAMIMSPAIPGRALKFLLQNSKSSKVIFVQGEWWW